MLTEAGAGAELSTTTFDFEAERGDLRFGEAPLTPPPVASFGFLPTEGRGHGQIARHQPHPVVVPPSPLDALNGAAASSARRPRS